MAMTLQVMHRRINEQCGYLTIVSSKCVRIVRNDAICKLYFEHLYDSPYGTSYIAHMERLVHVSSKTKCSQLAS